MSAEDVILNYYDSLSSKDNKWQELWTEAASFSDASKTLHAQGKNAVIQSFIPFLKGVDGVSLKQMIAEGKNICAIVHYVYINSKGDKFEQDVAEVWEVKKEKLAKLVIYFDLTAYRTFVRG